MDSPRVREAQAIDGQDARSGAASWLALAGFLAACFSVSAAGGMVTALSVDDWYRSLERPSFTPPEWVFGPVWTVLFIMMAVAGWRVWRRAGFRRARTGFMLFGVQLALNLLWPVLFFGFRSPGGALLALIVLWIVIDATTAAFWRVDKIAGYLFVPYALWVAFAGILNASIWLLN